MFGLTSGELFVVVFILVMVVSAPYWPRAGEALAAALGSKGGPQPAKPDGNGPENDGT